VEKTTVKGLIALGLIINMTAAPKLHAKLLILLIHHLVLVGKLKGIVHIPM